MIDNKDNDKFDLGVKGSREWKRRVVVGGGGLIQEGGLFDIMA